MTNSRSPCAVRTFLLLGALVVASGLDTRAQAPIHAHWEHYRVYSGNHPNATPVDGVAVWQHVIALPASVPWLRLHFNRALLGKESYLRITSLKDGDQQTLHQEHLEQWQFSSAFFNGNAVLLEIVAGPHTAKNSIEIEKVWAGDDPRTVHVVQSICGTTDDRVPSTNAAVGRTLGTGACTGWIINEPTTGNDKCHLSAGHCFGSAADVIQFNVPASNADCTLVHPPAASQFAINRATAVWVDGGIGNDYLVFRCFPNPTTNRTTFQQQAAAITLSAVVPPNNTALRVTGFGLDGTNSNAAGGGDVSCTCVGRNNTGQRNITQQTATGPLALINGNDALINVDLCGGNSGGPVFHEATGQGLAIVTHHGCVSNSNHATLVRHPNVRAAIIQVCGTANNDECNGATWVVDGVNGPFNNTTATSSSPTWPCQSLAGNDVWFSYVATCIGPVTIDTCAATRNFDTVLQVFAGDCGALLSAACNDDVGGTCATGSRVSFVAALNARYFIRVGGFNGARGQFSLTITGCNTADECAGGIPLPLGVSGPYGNATATTSVPAWPCGSGGNDIWFRYFLDCAAHVEFSTCWSSTNFDTVLQVFSTSGACGTLTSLGCSDDDQTCGVGSLNRASRLSVTTGGSTAFAIRVGGFNGARGRFALSVSQRPANDECTAPIALTSGINGPFCTTGASTSAPAWLCGLGGNDIWFRYTAPCSGLLVADTCSATRDFDTTLQVFGGSCASLASLGCNDDACGFGSSVAATVVANQTYFLRVGGFDGASGRFELNVRCTPPNDECAAAITVPVGISGPFSNDGATTSAPGWPCGSGGRDVWFRHVATCSAPHTFRTCSTRRTFDTTLQVFSGTCGALTSLGCNDDSCAAGSALTVPLAQAQTYYVRVGGFNGAVGAFDLEVQLGTGTGSLGRLPTGCGSTTLTATGNPSIGGSVTFQMGGVAGAPVMAIGFLPLNLPLCPPAPCTLGPNPAVSFQAGTYTLVIPCNPFLIGGVIYLQGFDLAAPGGCSSLNLRVTDTVVLTIG